MLLLTRIPPPPRSTLFPYTTLFRSFINAIGTAVPDHDIHQPFIAWALDKIPDPRQRKIFERMVGRSAIEHRWSVLPRATNGGTPDRKSTRLNSSHVAISYAVFCLKK